MLNVITMITQEIVTRFSVTVVGLDLATLTCVMLLYSFMGWFYESTIYSLFEQGKLMNRGYFIGPYCPIYAVVSIASVYFMEGIDSPIKIVILSGFIVSAIEYVTSYTLEKLFNTRYWDYSNYPLNLNGRVSVVSGLFFGLACLLLNKVVHPRSVEFFQSVPIKQRSIIALIIWLIFITDLVVTIISMCNLNKKIKALYDAWDEHVENGLDKLNSKKEILENLTIVKKGQSIVVKIKDINQTFMNFEMRHFRAYPKLKSFKYESVVDKLKEFIKR